jgi:hypothetical protein
MKNNYKSNKKEILQKILGNKEVFNKLFYLIDNFVEKIEMDENQLKMNDLYWKLVCDIINEWEKMVRKNK